MTLAVADSHVLVWMSSAPRKLGQRVARYLAAARAGQAVVYVPAMAWVEIGESIWRGRFQPSCSLEAWRDQLFSHPCFQPVDFTAAMALRAHSLYVIPERGDRLLAAAALELDCPLLTRDPDIIASGLVETIW